MKRLLRAAALFVGMMLVISCQALGHTANVTPAPKAQVPARAVSSSSACHVGATNEGLQTLAFKMTSPTSGWGLGKCGLASLPSFPNGSNVQCYAPQADWMGIMRSADGGATWTDVSPPNVPNRTWHRAQYFLDANHAWVGEVGRNADACVSQVSIFMTADGGRTWQQGATIPLKLPAPTDDVFNIAGPVDNMDFVDPQHGWLLVVSPPSNPTPSGFEVATTLYSTTDGGMHWRLVATNPGKAAIAGAGCAPSFYAPTSDVTFVSTTVGWLELACPPGGVILTTGDGGETWTARPLPTCGCNVFEPEFFDARQAVITGRQGSPAMLATSDGGATWTQRPVPAAAMTQFSFVDPNDGWMVGVAQLPASYETVVYRTTDGGQSWSLLDKPGFATVSSNPKVFFQIEQAHFFTAQAGFVLLGGQAGRNAQTDPGAPDLQLLATADGGKTWNVVLKQVPALPCLAGYHQLGNGQVDLQPVKMAGATTAWARGGLRTTDGGAHWFDVSPPALREGAATSLYPPGFVDSYLDGDHAWESAVYGSKTSCTDHVSTFATSDGGKTWRRSVPAPLEVAGGNMAASVQMGFWDATAGWLWVALGVASDFGFSESTDAYLYTTTDGGLSWRRSAHLTSSLLKSVPVPAGAQNCMPSFAGASFASPAVGWVGVNCADTMLTTRDGGTTWKVVSPAFGGGLPTFVDPSHGFVETYGTKGSPAPALLATSDGGVTWRPLPPLPSSGYVMGSSFLDASNIVVLVTPPGWNKGSGGKDWLYRSKDGGQSWTLVQKDLPIGRVYALAFADANHGMVTLPRNSTWSLDTPNFATSWDTELAVTADGGQTWKVSKPAIG